MRDLLAKINDELMNDYTAPNGKLPKGFGEKLENIQSCVKTVLVIESLDKKPTNAVNEKVERSVWLKSEVTLVKASLQTELDAAGSSENANGNEVVSRGFPRLSVNMGDADKAIKEVAVA